MRIDDSFIQRESNDAPLQDFLFEDCEDWKKHWWGMPSFSHSDARPYKSVVVNFLTVDDYRNFCARIEQKLSDKTNSIWHPKQAQLNSKVQYSGKVQKCRYPICIPSKGRYDNQTTGRLLEAMGVPHLFFVEQAEYELYRKHLGEARVVAMPFDNLGQGSIPARNFIWEWAKTNNHARHWVLDDNIRAFLRMNCNRRIICKNNAVLSAIEDFVDRYENIAMAGPHDRGFVKDREPSSLPIHWNSRVYSCILLNTNLPHRWRGKYNEDTDLSLRLLKDGYCTVLFRSLLISKPTTFGAKGKADKGGNTDAVYAGGDHRLAFAESLRDQHPDCVSVVWKFNRWHHQVDYSRFKSNKPQLRQGVTPRADANEYGMELHRISKEDAA